MLHIQQLSACGVCCCSLHKMALMRHTVYATLHEHGDGLNTFQHSVQGLGWHKGRKNGLLQGHIRAPCFLERQHVQKTLWTTCNSQAPCERRLVTLILNASAWTTVPQALDNNAPMQTMHSLEFPHSKVVTLSLCLLCKQYTTAVT